MEYDKHWMKLAISLAKKAENLGEVPVGAVICRDNKLISAAYNQRELDNNSLSHAEITAIDRACKRLGSWRLENCTLYVTLEPCPMCAGAIINSRITKVIFGASDPKSGCFGSLITMQDIPFNHKVEVYSGLYEEECGLLLTDFFANLRNKNI